MNKYLLLTALLAVAIGTGIIFGQVSPDSFILWNFRIPRVLFAAVNGAMLAVAGVLYQISLRNPMADGFTTGAASSAAFGGCLALVLWGNPWLVVLCAFVSAMIGVNLVRFMARRAGGFMRSAESNPVTIILAGITLSVIAGSGVSFLKYFFEDAVNTMVFWLMGSLARGSWLQLYILTALFSVIFATLLIFKRKISILFLDDHSALTTGVNVYRLREILFVLTTLLVALSVSFCGVISFMGLIVPHAVRMLFGNAITTQLICSALMGAAMLAFFDMLSRTAMPSGAELPIGIITSLCGGIFFCVLLIKRGSRVWQS